MPFLIGPAIATAGMSAATTAAATGFAIGADALIAGIAGTALTGYGQYAAGQQEKANAEYNAKVQQQQAEQERKAAGYEAGLMGEEGRRLQARRRVLFAKAGLSGAGTPLLVLQDTASKIEQDIQTTLYGGERRARYYEAGAGLSLISGKSAARAGLFRAGSSLLSGGSDTYYRYKMMKG